MIVSLKDLVLNGNFGPVHLGMDIDQVIELLGKPGHHESLAKGSAGLVYGWYEFFYYTESKQLYAMQNDHLQADCPNHSEMIHYRNDYFEVDPWFLTAGRDFTSKEVKDFLTAEGAVFEAHVFDEAGDHEYEYLKLQSGVTIDFAKPHSESGAETVAVEVLNGIRYFSL